MCSVEIVISSVLHCIRFVVAIRKLLVELNGAVWLSFTCYMNQILHVQDPL